MPRIPQYDAPQAELRPLPGARDSSVASPALFGAGGEQMQKLGAGAASLGGDLLAIETRQQEQRNADRLFAAESALKNDYLEFERSARERVGQNAWGVTQDAAKWWADAGKKHADGLENDVQRKLFGQTVDKLRLQSIEGISRHESAQRKQSLDDSAEASIVGSINLAAANAGDPKAIAAAKDDIVKRNQVRAQVNGWAPELRDAKQAEYLTNLHKQVIQSLVQKDPAAAQRYFELNKEEIAGAQRAEIGAFAERATANAVGESTADALWKSAGPQSDREPVQLDKLEEAARTQLKGNEPAMKAAISALRERVTAFNTGRKERDEATEAAIWSAVRNGAGAAQIRRMPEFLQMPADKASRILEHLDNRAATLEARAAARAQRADAEESRAQRALQRQGFAAYLDYSNPAVLDRLSENQIINMLPTLGNDLVGSLIDKKRSLVKNENKVIEARIDQQDFDHVATEAGLRPFDPKKTEEERASLGELKFRIEQLINARQGEAKRLLTRDEKMTLMRQELDNKVMIDRTLLPDTTKPALLLAPKEIGDAYVTVNGREVKLASIPAADRAEAIRELRAHGKPVSEQKIAEMWLWKQQQTKPRQSAGGTIQRGQ